MIKLILMRHAKSDWLNDKADIDRPLNDRGRRDALHMGRYLHQGNLLPDKILISPSERTRQTADLLLEGADVSGLPILVEETLYLASPTTLIEATEQHAKKNQCLLVLAHNPGMEELVSYLASSPPALSRNGKLMPTCTAAFFHLKGLEQLRQPATAELKTLIRIKEIGD